MATDPEDLDHSTVDPANLALGDQYHTVVPQMIGRIRQTPDTNWDPAPFRASEPVPAERPPSPTRRAHADRPSSNRAAAQA
jgi:hypothetical protein